MEPTAEQKLRDWMAEHVDRGLLREPLHSLVRDALAEARNAGREDAVAAIMARVEPIGPPVKAP